MKRLTQTAIWVYLCLMSIGWTEQPKTIAQAEVPASLQVCEPVFVTNPKETPYIETEESPEVLPPFLRKEYIGFKEALAFKESRGNYLSVNTLGYLGKYQFGVSTLQVIGVYNASKFLQDPVLQEQVFLANTARNKWLLRKYIEAYAGKWICGFMVTESGMLAAAHLAGPGNVKKYLRTGGRWDVSDAYGTSISDYMKEFTGYDVSGIVAVRLPRIKDNSRKG